MSHDFMAVDLGDVVQPQLLPKGTEANVRVIAVEAKPEHCMVQVGLEVTSTTDGHDVMSVDTIFHPLFYPKPDDDAKKVNNKKRGLKNFFDAFGITPQEQTDPSLWEGRTAWCKLTLEESAEYGDRNRVAFNGFISQQ